MHLRIMILYMLLVLFVPSRSQQCCSKLREEMKQKIDKHCYCRRKRECPVGFMRFKGVCYLFVMGNTNIQDWWDAQNFCRNHSGNLVTINDGRREHFIKEHLESNFNNTGYVIKIHTGLIYTDNNAHYPHCPHNSRRPSSHNADGVRWSSTKESVNVKGYTILKTDTLSKWSPRDIEGSHDGPSKSSYLSCVVIIWNPVHKSDLTWRFNDCFEKHFNLICEVRLQPYKSKPSSKKRNKRSSLVNHTFFGNDYVRDGADNLDDDGADEDENE